MENNNKPSPEVYQGIAAAFGSNAFMIEALFEMPGADQKVDTQPQPQVPQEKNFVINPVRAVFNRLHDPFSHK